MWNSKTNGRYIHRENGKLVAVEREKELEWKRK